MGILTHLRIHRAAAAKACARACACCSLSDADHDRHHLALLAHGELRVHAYLTLVVLRSIMGYARMFASVAWGWLKLWKRV